MLSARYDAVMSEFVRVSSWPIYIRLTGSLLSRKAAIGPCFGICPQAQPTSVWLIGKLQFDTMATRGLIAVIPEHISKFVSKRT